MSSECHALLKSYCAIKDRTVSDYCYDLIADDFREACRTDPQIRHLLTSGSYPLGSRADRLKQQIIEEFDSE